METPTFKTREELYTWLKENKEDIIYSKKSQFKKKTLQQFLVKTPFTEYNLFTHLNFTY